MVSESTSSFNTDELARLPWTQLKERTITITFTGPSGPIKKSLGECLDTHGFNQKDYTDQPAVIISAILQQYYGGEKPFI